MSKFNALATLNRVLQPLVERADDDDVRARVTITEEGDCQKRRYLINSTFHCYYLSFLLNCHLKLSINFILAGAENGVDQQGQNVPKADGTTAAAMEDGIPPTFTEKPKIIPNESGTLVTMKFRVRAKPKAEMQWYKGNQKIHEDSKFKSKYIELGNDEYEVLLEILVRTTIFVST